MTADSRAVGRLEQQMIDAEAQIAALQAAIAANAPAVAWAEARRQRALAIASGAASVRSRFVTTGLALVASSIIGAVLALLVSHLRASPMTHPLASSSQGVSMFSATPFILALVPPTILAAKYAMQFIKPFFEGALKGAPKDQHDAAFRIVAVLLGAVLLPLGALGLSPAFHATFDLTSASIATAIIFGAASGLGSIGDYSLMDLLKGSLSAPPATSPITRTDGSLIYPEQTANAPATPPAPSQGA